MSFLKKSLGVVTLFFTVIFICAIAISGQAGKIAPVETSQEKSAVTDSSAASQEGFVLGDETKAEEKVVEEKPVERVSVETQAPTQEEDKQVAPPASIVPVPIAPPPTAKVVAPSPPTPAPTPVKVTAPVAPQPTPAPAQVTKSNGKYYTSSFHSSKYYYPEKCDGWKSLSPEYLQSFDSLDALLAKYQRTLSPDCN